VGGKTLTYHIIIMYIANFADNFLKSNTSTATNVVQRTFQLGERENFCVEITFLAVVAGASVSIAATSTDQTVFNFPLVSKKSIGWQTIRREGILKPGQYRMSINVNKGATLFIGGIHFCSTGIYLKLGDFPSIFLGSLDNFLNFLVTFFHQKTKLKILFDVLFLKKGHLIYIQAYNIPNMLFRQNYTKDAGQNTFL
jgi:hypothetical protein